MARATTPPRRITRASLARFAYAADPDPADPADPGASPAASSSPDIEDAIPDLSPARAAMGQKRKRAATASAPAAAAAATTDRPAAKARKTRLPARTKADPETGEAVTTPPSDWEEMYRLVQEMRRPGGAASVAAVDTMGCERLASADASPRERRFHTLVALMLSSQTKDTVNAAAMARLKAELPPHAPGAPAGLTLENILAVEPEVLNRLIWAVGFHNNKTKYIKQAAIILAERHGGDIPPTIEGLTALPGVGPKMAHLCMSADNGWGRVEGIGVDVHVHRITNLWGWQRPPTRTPEATRLALQSWLPRDRWKPINGLLVGLGQTVCLPVGRRCGDCELGLRGLCRAADRAKVLAGRRARAEAEGAVVKTEETEETVVGETVVSEDVKAGIKAEAKTEVKAEVKTEP